jgi:hypothetical protein
MVSGAEIRKREERQRQKRRSTAANSVGLAVAIVIAFLPNRTQMGVALGLAFAAFCLIYGLSQTDWIAEADSLIKTWTRFGLGAVVCVILFAGFGAMIWPPVRRHTLSQSEREKFENPLKEFRHPQMSIHLYCAPEDEVDCEYAASLIPLFGEAGWDVSRIVERITLGRPAPGIIIGVHGTVKLEDEPKLKWNEGEWTKITPEEKAVRKAFVNIGIEPDSTSGAIVPENQINIYVGHEREDESTPTDMTRTFENLPDIPQRSGAQ